jgi:nonribosomal peptide synthetase DhbF
LPHALGRTLAGTCAEVWNMYGPTETTIWSTVARVQTGDESISIGGPIANTQVYVLDESRQPVPDGVYGEIYIGGAGLARGYYHRPELTSERFVRNTFHSGRMYRTGDVVRYTFDGRLEYLRRLDHQVKIRGFRVELGEIEQVLMAYPGISRAVVQVLAGKDGQAILAGFYIADAAPERKHLQEWLAARLPDYMRPSVYVPVTRFPMTDNGKVDRKRLVLPEEFCQTKDREFIAPRNPVEELIADLWQTALRVPAVSANDDFFHLGGESLLGARIAWQIRDALGIDLPIRKVLELRVLEDLAAEASQRLMETQSGFAELLTDL